MSSAKLTLIGYENYFQNINQSLFDNLRIPNVLDKETLTDNILLRGGEFEAQYGDPDFMRLAIGSWSNKWMPTMERWTKALAIEYNPLENYDRMEDWTDKTERSDATTSNNLSSRSHAANESILHTDNENISEARSENSNNSSNDSATYSQSDARTMDEDVEKVTDRDAFADHPLTHTVERSAYDSTEYEPLTKETDAGKLKETIGTGRNESAATSSDSSSNSSGSSSTNSSGASSKDSAFNESKEHSEAEGTESKTDLSSAMNNDFVHSGRIHGNIGTLTSQKMLSDELLLGYWNVYEKITELFLQEFTIPVYL